MSAAVEEEEEEEEEDMHSGGRAEGTSERDSPQQNAES